MKRIYLAIFLLASLPLAAQTLTSPLIVASGKLVGQTQAIAKTTLYTPSETGLFRVSFYICMTKPGSPNRQWAVSLTWTDDAGLEANQLADVDMNTLPPNAWAISYTPTPGFVFEAVAGQPISYAVVSSLGTGSKGTYSLYYTVEQLQ
jgi:hypothetical protein